MKFSVLIPVYNAEKYLDECLSSILNQTYKNFEIILVDDGSTDNSAVICDGYQKEFPEIVRVVHQENQGQLISRCNAIKAAQSDYCIFMDADDLIVENTFEVLLNAIEKYDFPDMIGYPFYYDRLGKLEKSRVISDEDKYYKQGDNTLRELFFSDILLNSMCTKCVKCEILKNSIYDTEPFKTLRCSEDRLQSMWILDKTETTAYINTPLYKYRLFYGSTTRQYKPDIIDRFNDIILYDEQIKYAQKWGLYSNQWLEKFHASIISHLIYVFDLFYLNVNVIDRSLVVEYSWSKFLSSTLDIDSIKDNNYLTETEKKMFHFIIKCEESKIKRYYLKKKIYQKIRSIKRKILR